MYAPKVKFGFEFPGQPQYVGLDSAPGVFVVDSTTQLLSETRHWVYGDWWEWDSKGRIKINCHQTSVTSDVLKKAPQTSQETLRQIRERIEERKIYTPGDTLELGNDGMNLGSDPEFWVVGKNGLVPSWERFKKKENLKRGDFEVDGSSRIRVPYVDGFQAEVQAIPAGCIDSLTEGLYAKLQTAQEYLLSSEKITFDTVQDVTPWLRGGEKEVGDGQLLELGCTPSKNVYGLEPIRVDGATLPWRPAGYHMHFQTKLKEMALERAVRMLDAVAGVMSVSVFQGMEDPRRRTIYGRAGEYRTPKHGLEWRVLSSAVMVHPAVHHLMWNMARAAFVMAKAGWEGIWDASEEETRETVDFLDVDQAKRALERNKDLVQGLLRSMYGYRFGNPGTVKNEKIVKKGWEFILSGAKQHMEVGEDAIKNWRGGAIRFSTWAARALGLA
jgi:hypothetical protein